LVDEHTKARWMDRETEVLEVDPRQPQPEIIRRAAEVLRDQGLVAFPTETVYGLGANALDPRAVQNIFSAKGRPANNPLIVHVADVEAARELAVNWPPTAAALAERFWPGALSMVVAKRDIVPDVATAGAATVALRVPAHPVALALLRASRLPIAAPSANRSLAVSPTRAEHVLKGLRGRIDLLLDAGPTPGGLESTVLDLSRSRPTLLRPGLVMRSEIEAVVGPIEQLDEPESSAGVPLASPGLMRRHYAPRAKVECVHSGASHRVAELVSQGVKTGWLCLGEVSATPVSANLLTIAMPLDPQKYAARLYAALHACDDSNVERIIVDLPPAEEAWSAVHDRLRRAAAEE
jgi:L-threonylcarbamoyladenylate synthase